MPDLDDRIRDTLSCRAMTAPADEDAWRGIQGRLVPGRLVERRLIPGRLVPGRFGSGWWPAIGAGLVAAVLILGTVLGIQSSLQHEPIQHAATNPAATGPATIYPAGPLSGPTIPPHCKTTKVFAFSVATSSGTGPLGAATPIEAVQQFAARNPALDKEFAVDVSAPTVLSSTATDTEILAGRATLDVTRLPDGSWMVEGGQRCL